MNSNLRLQLINNNLFKESFAIKSINIRKKGFKILWIVELETPITFWYDQSLKSYSNVLLKPRFLFQTFRKLKKSNNLNVFVASFENKNKENFEISSLNMIGIGRLYYVSDS